MIKSLEDFDREPYSGDVDTVTGFALVASANTCFVWKYTQVRACSSILLTFIYAAPLLSRLS